MNGQFSNARAFGLSVHWIGIACALGVIISAGTAVAQEGNTSPLMAIEEVVVTGSHIQGVAPVGSILLTVDAKDLQATGANNVTDMLRDLPQVLNIGFDSTGQTSGRNLQGGGGNGNFGRTINLRGLASQDTLTLVNGMRMSPSQSGTVWDIDSIPTLLVQRIDVVADGGSATYGADAVAGTVNVIFKAPTDVDELSLTGGHSEGQINYIGGLLVGRTWAAPGLGNGGFMVAIDYDHQDPLYAPSRSGIYNDNLQQYYPGAAPLSAFTYPGNVVIGGNFYAVPTGIGSSQGITLSQLGPINQPTRQSIWNAHNIIGNSDTRWAGGFNFKQDIRPWLHFFANGYGQWRRGLAEVGGSVQPQTLSVPNTNPYSPCAPTAIQTNSQGIVCPVNGTISVQANIEAELGKHNRSGLDKTFMLVDGFDMDLPYEWKATMETNLAGDYSVGQFVNVPNATALNQVLSGVNKPSNVPFFNPFCIQSITTRCNSPVTDAYFNGSTTNTFTNNISQTTVNFDGPVFELPGGQIRLAVGAEYENEGLFNNDYSSATPAVGVKVFTPAYAHKNVASHYEELYVPIVGKNNAMTGIQSLELTLANRYTAYSDFGVTDNPKIGMNYSPIDGVTIHGSAGTSFRAPSLRDASPTVENLLHVTNNLLAPQFPGITLPAGTPTTAAFSEVDITGGQPGIRPETARSWSLGFDWAPLGISGLDVNVNYFNIHLQSQIGQVATDAGNAVVNDPQYSQFVIFNPIYFPTRAVVNQAALLQNPSLALGAPLSLGQFTSIIANIIANPKYASSAVNPQQPVIWFCDCRRANSGSLRTDGFDIAGNYSWDMEWASANVGIVATYLDNYNAQITSNGPVQNLDNTFNYPIRFSSRLHARLDRNGWSGALYLNYKNPYRANPTLLDAGAPPSFQHIRSNTTIDASLSYNTKDNFSPYFDDTRITLAVTNVFNTPPPLVLSSGNSAGINYDATEASAIGRHIGVTLDKKF